MKRWVIAILAAWALLGLTCWIYERLLVTDEKRILQQLEVLRMAAQSGQLLTLRENLASDYRDDWNHDRVEVIQAVMLLRESVRHLQIHIEHAQVHLQGATARADLRVLMFGKETGEPAGLQGERADYQLTFHKEDGKWKLSHVHRVGDAPLGGPGS